MKRNLIIATVTAAALVTGGTAAAFAVAEETPSKPHHAVAQSGDDRDDAADAASDAEEARDALRGTEVTAAEALRAVAGRGTVTSLELDDDGARTWDVELVTKDGTVQDWTVDAKTAKAVQGEDRDTEGQDKEDQAGNADED
ncbi:PepSY domain-containing protein [Streptomyces sp. NPDC013953]|uniref:PepSY domain-containing protein n=1 Tax=Streptomyces sp. NPDC013953 TaxID=3364868 RepID=UPI0036F8930E